MSAAVVFNVVVEALRPRLENNTCDLADCLPLSRRKAVAFVERYGDELEMMLGKRPVVVRSEAIASGRGAFGRDKGGSRAKAASVRIQWAP